MPVRDILVDRVAWERTDRHQSPPQLPGDPEAVKLIDRATGQTIAVQYLLGDLFQKERTLLSRWLRLKVHYPAAGVGNSAARASGMNYPSTVFGYTESKPLRSRWSCSAAHFGSHYPEPSRLLTDMTATFWDITKQHFPEQTEYHETEVRSRVLPNWLIDNQPWTSGIINNTAALPYHKDSGNIGGTLSAMLCIRKGIDGGALHLPEYDYTFAIPDGSLTIFDGQAAWHGVTPLIQHKNGYRFTLVWYAKSGMCKCLAPADEIRRAQRRATPE